MRAITFVVERHPEGGFVARAAGTQLVVRAATREDLRPAIEEAIFAHFPEGEEPEAVRLHWKVEGDALPVVRPGEPSPPNPLS